jgi:hypothetical protein
MIYNRGGARKPSVVTTKAGPLLISRDHRGTADEKPARISLSDVFGQTDRIRKLDQSAMNMEGPPGLGGPPRFAVR